MVTARPRLPKSEHSTIIGSDFLFRADLVPRICRLAAGDLIGVAQDSLARDISHHFELFSECDEEYPTRCRSRPGNSRSDDAQHQHEVPHSSFRTIVWRRVDGSRSFLRPLRILDHWILLNTKKSQGYFKNFYVRRVLRIWPLYFLLIFFMFVVVRFLTPSQYHAVMIFCPLGGPISYFCRIS